MAIPATLIHEVRTTGNDANGGGFDPANANFATDGTVDTNTGNTASPVFSSASYNFVTGDIGAWLFIKSGTNSIPGWYQIASVGSNKATLTATIGSAFEMVANLPYRANTAAGIATVGTPTGLTWGIDYSQQASAQIAYTDMVIGSAGAGQMTFTSAGNPVGKNIIGNVLNVTGGTGFTVQRVVVSSTSGTTATVVATGSNTLGTAASTGGTANLGGAWLSLGAVGAFNLTGHAIAIKYNASAFSVTSSGTNSAGACYQTPASSAMTLFGYDTNRSITNTDANRPTFEASGISTFTLISTGTSSSSNRFYNLIADGNALSASKGFAFQSTGRNHAYNCKAIDCTTGFDSGAYLFHCYTDGCTTGFTSQKACFDCEAKGGTTGFNMEAGGAGINSCRASGCSGDGFSGGAFANFITACTAYGCGGDGFDLSGTVSVIASCVSYGNTGYGFRVDASAMLLSCYAGNNGSGNLTSTSCRQSPALVNLTADPFTNAASFDFSPNNTAGGGALLRAGGLPGVSPSGTSTGYRDAGMFQHQDAGGGSGGGPLIGGRLVQA